MLETGSGAKRAITIGNGANATNGTSEVNREEPLTSQPTVTKNTSADLALQPGNAVMGSRSTPSDDGIRVSMIDDQHALDMKTSSTRDDVSITVEVDRPDTDHSTENASTDQDISALVPVVAGFVGSSMDALLGSPAVDTSDADDKAMDINSSETGLSQEGSVSGSTDHVTDPGSAPKDSSDRSAAEATPTLTQDSVSTATDPLLAAAAGPSPWEISAMVGAILTGSAYSGSNSADWTPGLSDRWTTTAGAEVMHLGRNFGIGTGNPRQMPAAQEQYHDQQRCGDHVDKLCR